MSRLGEWLERRRPAPPPDLAASLGIEDARGPVQELLVATACRRLDEASRRPGRVRDSAFRLLEADALLTYACEAALEGDDAKAALEEILAVAGQKRV